MKVLVDADSCPVLSSVIRICRRSGTALCILCDTNHILEPEYGELKVIGAGKDAVDMALINMCAPGDVVVTQDYGVAAMVLGKNARCINPSGHVFSPDNIDGLLMDRHIGNKMRHASGKKHLRGPSARTREDDERFERNFLLQVSENIN